MIPNKNTIKLILSVEGSLSEGLPKEFHFGSVSIPAEKYVRDIFKAASDEIHEEVNLDGVKLSEPSIVASDWEGWILEQNAGELGKIRGRVRVVQGEVPRLEDVRWIPSK